MEAAAPYAFFTLPAVAVVGLGLSAPMHKVTWIRPTGTS